MIRRVSSFVFRVSLPVLLVALGGTAETHKYTPKKEDLKYTFATAAPVLKLKPGDTLETWTERADGNTLQKPGDWFPPGRRPNPQTGPFYIEGAEPGDTLGIHLISVEPAADAAVGDALHPHARQAFRAARVVLPGGQTGAHGGIRRARLRLPRQAAAQALPRLPGSRSRRRRSPRHHCAGVFRRQHGHARSARRDDCLSAGERCGGAALPRRRPRRAGRRRNRS